MSALAVETIEFANISLLFFLAPCITRIFLSCAFAIFDSAFMTGQIFVPIKK